MLTNKVVIDKKYKVISEYREFDGMIVDVKDDSITIKNNKIGYKVTFFISSYVQVKDKVELGDYVIINGKLKEKLQYRENNMASRGLASYGSLRRIISVDKEINYLNLPIKIKNKINTGLTSVDKSAGAFVSGIITGYRSDITEEDMQTFNELDIVHIIAVSGFNVAIIYAVVMILTKNLKMRKRLIISLFICGIYVSITGFDPSITRAFIMITIVIIGRLLEKRYSTLNALAFAAFLMLSINPFYVYNLGFIFSYLATLSISLFSNDILSKVEGYTKLFKDEVSATISSTILTFPIIIYNKGYFSLISLFVNVLLGPVVSLITILGFISCFLYAIIPFTMILYPVIFLGDITLYLIGVFGKINPLIYTGQPTVIFMISYYIVILSIAKLIKFKKEFYRYTAIVLAVSIVLVQGSININNLKVHFINVGQGDSIFIELPGRGSMLIDTGNANKDYIAAKSKVIPYIKKLGYSKIDYLIISHFHDDHSGGVEYIEKNMPINNKISHEGSENKDYIGTLKGDILNVSGVNFKILSPSIASKKQDENKNSLIIELVYKNFNALFTGDATKDEMDIIKGDYDVLKVPHHGSKYSVSEDMFNNTDIETAVITVGNNNFGHPSKECMDSFHKRNIKVFRTDKNGNIVYIVNSLGYKVKFNN
ncbi:DNA internalization-related competence protein ComEC/Rec2 [Clostridium cylindrosporum]|uniref:DNA internalization-related competence protein ComEC/Rec2 n=1 Tax=Clostridium cylindrosporum TaxID=1495 RepID=UPI0013791E63|nr:DNA internalization-related competence protein ComEC/Rec2 [Clostridium cylindrosporum]